MSELNNQDQGRSPLSVLEGDPRPHTPRGSRTPGAIQSLQWFRDPVAFMRRNADRRGSVFSVRLGPLSRCTFIADPELAWPVLTGDPDVMRMGSTNGIFRPVLGDGSLFLLDGEEHRRHRKLVMPAFHRGSVRRFSGLVAELAAREVASWPTGTPFSLQERMRSVTLDVIFRAVLGVVDDRRDERLRRLIHELLDRVQSPIAVLPAFQRDLGGRSPYAQLIAVVEAIDSLLYEEIGERRYDPGVADRDDVLSMLVRPQSHEPGYLSDREVRDELITLLIAGHETTATALSWTFERLLRHPEALARTLEELGTGDDDAYLDAVVRESLRQRPVLPVTARKLSQPIQLGEWTFPKGWTLMPCVYLIHQDPANYPEPDSFRPERFLSMDGPRKEVWLPFGAGARHCLGSSLSMMAIKVILRTVLNRAELGPDRPQDEGVVRRNFTLGPERGARVIVHRRLEPRIRTGRRDPVGSDPSG
ncbi:MAG TPA: cytochrome P450 [Solirubrobacterales bacterium]|nr:cytochrome P450 [Solirubrobacterales bacterium]